MITEILDGYTQLTFDPASWPGDRAVHWVLIDRNGDQFAFPGELCEESLTIESHHVLTYEVELSELLAARVVAFWIAL